MDARGLIYVEESNNIGARVKAIIIYAAPRKRDLPLLERYSSGGRSQGE